MSVVSIAVVLFVAFGLTHGVLYAVEANTGRKILGGVSHMEAAMFYTLMSLAIGAAGALLG